LETINLKAKIRTTVGNGPARGLRCQGRIPAVLYGPDTETMSLSVDRSELEKVLKKGQTAQLLLNLIIENGKESKRSAMIKELQTHPATHGLLHVDFYEISMSRKIRVNIPVVTVGKARGVELGGLLQVVRRELEVHCLPGDIPKTLEIDISDLDIGGTIHVQDIALPENVEIPADVNFTVVSVVNPKRETLEGGEGMEGEPPKEAGAGEPGEGAAE